MVWLPGQSATGNGERGKDMGTVGCELGILSGVRWHSDDGHAWLEVPLASCEGLAVSAYSYKDATRGVAYLEEDCDAGAWVRFHGLTYAEFRQAGVPRKSWYGDCFVRELPRFRAVTA